MDIRLLKYFLVVAKQGNILSPERTTGHVLAWKKNRIFHSAASRFHDYIRETEVSE